MKRVGGLIPRYLLTTVIPYFVLSWLLLSVILFVQQASRFSDTFFSANIPANLVWQLTIALVPNVVAFTCPMAMLVGTIIGLTKMQGDSELVAIRASGVGSLQIAMPIMILGVLMSIFAFFVNLEGVPLAATLVRGVALQTAIKKLESPIEPGVFNTEVSGYTIYVKGADLETSTWKNIFIYTEDKPNYSIRLITSRNGRIDTTGQQSELVLENATISTLPLQPNAGKYISETISDFRLAIKTRRNELIDRLSISELRPEELGLQELSDYASAKTGAERTEAQILWQRRIILSITPFIFCILGTVIVLRFSRGGRGFGIAIAISVLVGFYLLAFLGEQLARVGAISVVASSLIPLLGSLIVIAWLGLTRNFDFLRNAFDAIRRLIPKARKPQKIQAGNFFVDLTTGLRDFDLIVNLSFNFVLTLIFLTAIFLIFTAFELWKFAGTIDGGVGLLVKYLFFLLPFVYLQIAPSAAMIGTLATYVIKSRNNEIVTWTSAGQSVYRLLMPCFLMTVLLGAGNWLIQEKVLPRANQLQDETRSLIRNRGVPLAQTGKYWVANEKRIYSFEFASDNDRRKLLASGPIEPGRELSTKLHRRVASDNDIQDHTSSFHIFSVRRQGNASDNGKRVDGFTDIGSQPGYGRESAFDQAKHDHSSVRRIPAFALAVPGAGLYLISTYASDNDKQAAHCRFGCVRNLIVYEFADNGERLQTVYRADLAEWSSGSLRFVGIVEKNDLRAGKITTDIRSGGELQESLNPFAELRLKPNHLNTPELKRQIQVVDSDLEKRNLAIGLEKKYSTLFLPLIMALFTSPFALSLSRKGKAATVGYAVMLWLLFTGTSTLFERAGASGMLSPELAIWSPLIIFASLGVFLLSKVRT